MTHATPRAVLWDLDGTVLDSRNVHWEAWRLFTEELGRPMSQKYFNDTFGFRNEIILRHHFGEHLSDEDVERLAGAKEALYRDLLARSGAEPLPGVREWLRWISDRGWLQALASMAPPENIEVTLSALGIEHYFSAIANGQEVQSGKPAPDVFLLAAERLGVAPGACTVIEDSPQGVQGARRGGMRSLGVGPLYETLDADRRLRTLADASPEMLEAA